MTLVEVLVVMAIGGLIVGLVAMSANLDSGDSRELIAEQLRELRTRAVRTGKRVYLNLGPAGTVTCRPDGTCLPGRIATAEGEWRIDRWTGEVRRAR